MEASTITIAAVPAITDKGSAAKIAISIQDNEVDDNISTGPRFPMVYLQVTWPYIKHIAVKLIAK